MFKYVTLISEVGLWKGLGLGLGLTDNGFKYCWQEPKDI